MKTEKHIHLEGKLGADPEVKILKNGHKVASFPLAVKQLYQNTIGECVTDIIWHNVIAWGNLAAIAEKELHKGMIVLVDGIPAPRWNPDHQPDRQLLVEIIANELFIRS